MNLAETSNAAFGGLPAVGHLLRSANSDRWLRVHSLPNSKRYAETDAEYDEILRRHNELALEILGPHGRAVLFLHAWGTAADLPAAFSGFGWATPLDLESTSPTIYPSPEADDPDLVVAGFPILWSPGAWDSLLRDIANDRLPSVVVLNPATGEAYAPYDGGADLFLANSERVATLADRWASWLSERPDGL
ncbi:MAG: hypothetical protein ABUL62_20295 [Myxococcales bacterium]